MPHIHIHTYAHDTHTCTHRHAHTYTYTDTYTHIYMHTHSHAHTHAHVCIWHYVHVCMCMIHLCVYIYMFTHIHTNRNTCLMSLYWKANTVFGTAQKSCLAFLTIGQFLDIENTYNVLFLIFILINKYIKLLRSCCISLRMRDLSYKHVLHS